MKLEGRRAVISGGNRGLGLAIAGAFAREGAELLLGARDLELTRSVAGRLRADFPQCPAAHAEPLDVSSDASVERLAARAGELWGGVDILVNNAGVYGPKGPLAEGSWEEWKQAVDINLFGLARMCRAFLPALKRGGGGRIINLSGGGATSPLPNLSSYAASKAAVVRLSETLALELKPFGIPVNCVAPGALNTRLLDEVLEAGPGKVGEAFYRKSLEQKAKGGTPPELGASLCLYLAAEAPAGITGRLISAVWDPWKDLAALRAELEGSDIYTLRRITPEDRGKRFP